MAVLSQCARVALMKRSARVSVEATFKEFLTGQTGDRTVILRVEYYNLKAIISLGYRVMSAKQSVYVRTIKRTRIALRYIQALPRRSINR